MQKFLRGIAGGGIVIFGLVSVASAASDAAAGKESYVLFCTRCHGKSGQGNGPAGALLATKPRDFTNYDRMQAINDQELVAVIREGGPALRLSKDMPPWGNILQEQEIADLVAYIRSFYMPSAESSADSQNYQ